MNQVNLFLDSGAFSAFSKGVTIDIDKYISFIKEYEKYLDVYANLDVIGDPEATLKNQKYMESKGLTPLPCFHYGEDVKYLKHYVQNYSYIALGGMVPIITKNLVRWLDDLWSNYLTDSKGAPKVKVHGFGMTSLLLLVRYPWFSVDSTSWVMCSRFGAVVVPRKRFGKYIYNENSWIVAVSNKSPRSKEEGRHYSTFSSMEQRIIFDYFECKKFKFGKSDFKQVSTKYKLDNNEKWFDRKSGMVEIIIENGLCNDYKERDKLNIIYFLDLERNLPAWPWAFEKRVESFGLLQGEPK